MNLEKGKKPRHYFYPQNCRNVGVGGKIIEQLLSPKGEVQEEREAQDVEANVNDVSPVTWSKIRMKRSAVVRKFAFKSSLQLGLSSGFFNKPYLKKSFASSLT